MAVCMSGLYTRVQEFTGRVKERLLHLFPLRPGLLLNLEQDWETENHRDRCLCSHRAAGMDLSATSPRFLCGG